MLRIEQTRRIEWDREASEFDDSTMVAIADVMLNVPVFWTELESGKTKSESIELDGRRILIVSYCLTPEDFVHLRILSAQFM